MRKRAFGAIDLLIGLLITTAVFLIGMNAFKGVNFQNTQSDVKSIQDEVDTQVNQIEQMRQQNIEIQNNMLKEAQ
jgi:uncharacterized membrane-anchored protein YhcB (DUF1043 family)